MSKICNECNIEKSLDLFHKRNKIEHKGKCKECIYKISVLDIGKKKCTQCNNEKPLECFSKYKRNKCGYRSNCKECENKLFPTTIAKLQGYGERIFVGDVCESIHFVKYRRQDNVLSIFADDTSPR
jgi:hypothetical protein